MIETHVEDGLHEALCSLIASAGYAVVLEMGHELPLSPSVEAAAYEAAAKGLAEIAVRPGTNAAVVRTTSLGGTVQVEVEALDGSPAAANTTPGERRRVPRWLRGARTSR